MSTTLSSSIEAARLALAAGDNPRAESHLLAALEQDHDNIFALQGLTRIAIARKDYIAAVRPLERLHALGPQDAQVAHSLAIAYAQIGQRERACDILSVALREMPNFLSARLHLGMYLQDAGRTADACREFGIALRQAREQNAQSQAPPQLLYLLDQARKTIKQTQLDIYQKAVFDLRATYGDAALAKIDACVEIYLKQREPDYAHPKQRPATMYIPGLAPRPFFEREEFLWITELEAATATIRAELLPVLDADQGFEPYVQLSSNDPQVGAWASVNHSRSWSAMHLYRHGKVIEANASRCPQTMAILDKLPLMRIRDHAPEVVVSVLQPNAHIPPHYGSVNGRLIVHLPLVVPINCGALAVAGELRQWEEARCLVFDDSFVHEAWNNSNQVRVVLLLDVWNPQLSEAERQAFAAALVTLDEFNVKVLGNRATTFV